MTDTMTFSQKLEEAISTSGQNMSYWATRIGISYRTLQNWKNNVATPPEYVQNFVLKEFIPDDDTERLEDYKNAVLYLVDKGLTTDMLRQLKYQEIIKYKNIDK